MARQLSVLCVHGISHGNIDPDLESSWSKINERTTSAGNMNRLHLLDNVKSGDARVRFYSSHSARISVYGYDRLDACIVPHDCHWTPKYAIADKPLRNLYSLLT